MLRWDGCAAVALTTTPAGEALVRPDLSQARSPGCRWPLEPHLLSFTVVLGGKLKARRADAYRGKPLKGLNSPGRAHQTRVRWDDNHLSGTQREQAARIKDCVFGAPKIHSSCSESHKESGT